MDGINESIDLETVNNNQSKDKTDKTNNENENNYNHGNKMDDDSESMHSSSRQSTTDTIDFTKSNEYKELYLEIKNNLLCAVKLQLKNPSALVRRVIVLLLEFLGTTTIRINDLLTSYVCIRV